MKKNKKKVLTRKSNNVIIIIAGALILILAILFLTNVIKLNSFNSDNGNGKNMSLNDFYSEESCRCLEKKMPLCKLDGFEYNSTRNLCVNSAQKTVTYNTWGCSLYECSGIKYSFNNNTNGWEAE